MQTIKQLLEKYYFPVWTDENLKPGEESWKRGIETAIDDATCAIVLFTEDSKKSEWVRHELDYVAAQSTPLIPLLASGNEQNAVPFAYASYQWIDIRPDRDFHAASQKLINQIREYIQIPFDPRKTANLYWAGYDLIFLLHSTDSDREKLLRFLRQSQHHLRELGFEKYANELFSNYLQVKEASSNSDGTMPDALQARIRTTVGDIINKIGPIVNASQPEANLWSDLK